MIERCSHEEVCKFKVDGPDEVCGIQKVCKHADDNAVAVAEPKKRRGRKPAAVRLDEGGGEDPAEPKIGEREYKAAKARLDYLNGCGKLSENQTKALEGVKGKHFKTLSEVQKQQIIDMAKELEAEE